MAVLAWDQTGSRYYENGVQKCALYPMSGASYPVGVAWNGITKITESPEGGDPTDLWADNIKYGTMRAAEKFGGTIEAYTYPPEWEECDGSATPIPGVAVGQQARKTFGLCYRTEIGNDATSAAGYRLHVVYGATASPSSRDHETINDSPDAVTMSWEFEALPAAFSPTGSYSTLQPAAHIMFDSIQLGSSKMAALESALYGTSNSSAYLPAPDALLALVAG